MADKTPITVAHGDGIGPEIMDGHAPHPRGRRRARSTSKRSRSARRSTCAATPPASRRRAWESLRRTKVFLKAPDHDAPGRRLQEPQRHDPQDPRPLRQRPALRLLPPLRRDQASRDGRRHRARERGGPLRRRSSIGSDARRLRVPEADHPPGLREDRPLRLRVRAPQQPQEGHLLHQRQHHEDDRRPLPQGLRRDRRAVSRTSSRSTGSSTSAPPSWPTRPRSSTSS